jgi:hypothetical protein
VVVVVELGLACKKTALQPYIVDASTAAAQPHDGETPNSHQSDRHDGN